MTYEIVIRPLAAKQTTLAYEWYEEKLQCLGDEFLSCIDAQLLLILNNPFIYQIKYKNVRIGLIDRFPFGIYYFIDSLKIVVLSILHLSRSNDFLINR